MTKISLSQAGKRFNKDWIFSNLDFHFDQGQQYFPSYVYDTSAIRNYMSNINPDTTKEVMCVLTSASSAINFTVCNDPNYAALQAFTASQRQRGAPVVPEGKQLQWRVSAAFLARGAVFAFANATRRPEQVLLRSLFDDAARCGVGEKMSNRVCLVSSDLILGMNGVHLVLVKIIPQRGFNLVIPLLLHSSVA
jgi:hypothetical protein